VLVLAKVTQTSVIEDASEHKRQAMGGAIVDDLRRKYPGLVVKRQEIAAHHAKQLTSFRVFLTNRITKPA
jgi:hypothetical protein